MTEPLTVKANTPVGPVIYIAVPDAWHEGDSSSLFLSRENIRLV